MPEGSPEVGQDRESRAALVRASVHAYFMWHTGQLPGITREWIDNRARNISNEFVSSELIPNVDAHWCMYSLKAQLDREDRTGEKPVITLDASVLSMGQHLPPVDMLPQIIPDSALSVPQIPDPETGIAPPPLDPLFNEGNDFGSGIEKLMHAYRMLPNFLLYYYELVMEEIEDVQRNYLQQVDFVYASSLANVHFEPPAYTIMCGNLETTSTVHELRQSNDIGKLKRLKAQVIHTGGTNSTILMGAFKCSGTPKNPCATITHLPQDPYDDVLREPSSCPADTESGGCGRKKGEIAFTLLNKPETTTDTIQMIQVQDVDSEDGSPKTIHVEMRGDLCGEIVDGGFVTLDGVLMSKPIGRGKKHREPYFFCTAIVENGKTRTIAVSPEDEEVIRNWISERSVEQVMNDLAKHFAPIIHGHMNVKKAIILQTVGGIRIESQGKRGDLHILLLGDPGVAKSQLLNAAVKASPGSHLYDCSQATQAGLVAAAEKLKDAFSSGESWGIKAGALALTPDHAICALDEFHLLGGKDKTVVESLNVALEAQEVRISKAAKGVVRTRVAVLMAANPRTRDARFDPDSPTPLYQQAGIKVNTASRTDYVAIMRDLEEEALDISISESMWDAADPALQTLQSEVFPIENFMPKLVTLAKRIETVFFEPKAKSYLVNSYNDARKNAGAEGKVTPRRNESLRRFVQAVTRLTLQGTATINHAKFAEKLMRTSMTDTHPGQMDGGQTSKQKELYDKILSIFGICYTQELDKNPEADFVHLDAMETYVSQNWDSKIDKPARGKIHSAMKAFEEEGRIERKGYKYAPRT